MLANERRTVEKAELALTKAKQDLGSAEYQVANAQDEVQSVRDAITEAEKNPPPPPRVDGNKEGNNGMDCHVGEGAGVLVKPSLTAEYGQGMAVRS